MHRSGAGRGHYPNDRLGSTCAVHAAARAGVGGLARLDRFEAEGWRVRVVVPVTKSGSFLPKLDPTERSGIPGQSAIANLSQSNPSGTILTTFTRSSDLLGYEVGLYPVQGERDGTMHVVFLSAVDNEGGKMSRRRRPIVQLFQLPASVRYVRILHMTRGDMANYDAAILASESLDALDTFARRVERQPTACHDAELVYCSWIPHGVAVIAEPAAPR